MKIFIYECDNPRCNLRFPVLQGSVFNERCPKCLAKVGVVLESTPQIQDPAEYTQSSNQMIVVLDNIRSAFNVGAILRTSECYGIQKVILCGITPHPDDKNVQKASLGAEKLIQVEYQPNLLTLIQQLKQQGYYICSLELAPTAIDIRKFEAPNQPIVLIVGNERCGVDASVLDISDKILKIPMRGVKNSLNVEVSFGIAVNALVERS